MATTQHPELLAEIYSKSQLANGVAAAIDANHVASFFQQPDTGRFSNELADLAAMADVATEPKLLTTVELYRAVRAWATDNNMLAHPPLPNRNTWIFVSK